MTAVTFRQPVNGTVQPPQPGIAGQLALHVTEVIKRAAAAAPRSQQVSAGPSELGTPCTRRLGYRLLNWPRVNTDTDPWASIVGTSVHAWMAEAFQDQNRLLGHDRYLVEHTVTLPGGIPGHCDLYDRETKTVADWKVTGKVADYRRQGPGSQYRTQAQLYALGMRLAGEVPENVAIVFLPRGGRIDAMHVWSEPYDPVVATGALARYQQVFDFHTHLDPEAHPERWAWLQTADAYCTYCPWYLPGSRDLASGCPGHQKNTT